MRILAVDDEKTIRWGIIKILEDNFSSIDIHDAKNGEEALTLFKEHGADIIITDIKMPVMDGVEFMKEVRRLSTTVRIVVLSGFDDFSYARAALQNGASAYLLKPLDKAEFIDTIGQLVNEVNLNLKGQQELLLRRGFYEKSFTADMKEELSALLPYRVVVSDKPIKELHSISSSVYFRCGDDIPKQTDGVIAYSLVKYGLDELQEAVKEARCAFFNRFLSSTNVFPGTVITGEGQEDVENQVTKLNSKIGIAEEKDITKAVENLFSIPNEVLNGEYLYHIHTALQQILYSDKDYSEEKQVLDKLKGITSLEEWKDRLLSYVIHLNEEQKAMSPDNSFIPKALKFIEENFGKDINMAVVSNEVGISYTYFSEKFKEYTGGNFTDYLNSFRVSKAKEFLKKGCYRIYEVADLCGFSSPRYFIKIFKNETGVTPTNYQNKYQSE